MSKEIIKELAEEGVSIMYGESVGPVGSEEGYLLSETTFNKLIEQFRKIYKKANELND